VHGSGSKNVSVRPKLAPSFVTTVSPAAAMAGRALSSSSSAGCLLPASSDVVSRLAIVMPRLGSFSASRSLTCAGRHRRGRDQDAQVRVGVFQLPRQQVNAAGERLDLPAVLLLGGQDALALSDEQGMRARAPVFVGGSASAQAGGWGSQAFRT
jgi:hypothetical protein